MEYWLKTNNFTCSFQVLDSANYFKESETFTIQEYYDNLYLPKVKNLVYDPKNSILSWDKVEGAYKYKLEADYGVYIIKDNRFKYEPKYKTTFFKVSTIPSSTDYLSNNPSSLSYEDKESDLWNSVDLDKVNKFVNGISRNYDLVKITSMYVDDQGFHVQGWFKDFDGTKVIDMKCYYGEKISNLEDIMTKNKIAHGVSGEYDRSYYDPAVTIQHLLNSDHYVGELENARLQGYDISYVSGVVGRMSSKQYEIFGTYKLTRGDEVKYVQSEILCNIINPS